MLCLNFQYDFEDCFTFKHYTLMSPINLHPYMHILVFRDQGPISFIHFLPLSLTTTFSVYNFQVGICRNSCFSDVLL